MPTTYYYLCYLLPTTYYISPTTYHILPITHYLPTTYYEPTYPPTHPSPHLLAYLLPPTTPCYSFLPPTANSHEYQAMASK